MYQHTKTLNIEELFKYLSIQRHWV